MGLRWFSVQDDSVQERDDGGCPEMPLSGNRGVRTLFSGGVCSELDSWVERRDLLEVHSRLYITKLSSSPSTGTYIIVSSLPIIATGIYD